MDVWVARINTDEVWIFGTLVVVLFLILFALFLKFYFNKYGLKCRRFWFSGFEADIEAGISDNDTSFFNAQELNNHQRLPTVSYGLDNVGVHDIIDDAITCLPMSYGIHSHSDAEGLTNRCTLSVDREFGHEHVPDESRQVVGDTVESFSDGYNPPTRCIPEVEEPASGCNLHFDNFDEFATASQQSSLPQLTPTSTLKSPTSISSKLSPASSKLSGDTRKRRRNVKNPNLLVVHKTSSPNAVITETEISLTKLRDLAICKIANGERCDGDLSRLAKYNSALDLIQLLHGKLREPCPHLPVNMSLSSTQVDYGLKFLQEAQKESDGKRHAAISLAQKLILRRPINVPGESNIRHTLVIGVDATPTRLGGYCVNLSSKTVQYYSIREKVNVWRTMEQSHCNPAEFETKNLLLALTIWNKEIAAHKHFSVYSDNASAANKRGKYGSLVEILIQHFTNCLNAVLVNSEIYVNRATDLESFAKFIQPADDLSRRKIRVGVDYLCKLYSIDRKSATGIEAIQQCTNRGFADDAFRSVPPYFDDAFQNAKAFIDSLRTCTKCSSSDIIKLLSSVDMNVWSKSSQNSKRHRKRKHGMWKKKAEYQYKRLKSCQRKSDGS